MAKLDRKERLAQQLRDNLKKRKRQARARNSLVNEEGEPKAMHDQRSDGSGTGNPQKLNDE